MIEKSKIRLQELSHRWLKGTLTKAEQQEFDEWFNEQNQIPIEMPSDIAKNREEHEQAILNRIKYATGIARQPKVVSLWPRIAIAATVASIIFGAVLFYFNSDTKNTTDQIAYSNDVKPGVQGATLTLADGKKISINDAVAGNIALQSGVKISKTIDGQIIYEVTDQNSETSDYNTLTTSRGEQTQVRLPDGSLVFLNSASSLKYPTSFVGAKFRRVTLTGEGYFEISKDKVHPFLVQSNGQEVEVLGTHFNINAYKDEKAVRTTLLEGAVKITPMPGNRTKSSILKPGQQSALDENGIQVTEVDLEEAMAWQKGYFSFYDEDISAVMRKVSRWYNIEVEYQGQLPDVGFNARIDKYSDIKEVLKILQKSKAVHFKLEGRKVIVSK
ncbi:hypothetical protein ASU31_12965 [Pedobacter ginsenosidimutans]|uniref:Anti-sigma factor n=1 Tax=Pedobacter ginsenosidimutans TaxID=687842 RepID=A0A0T5VQA4_9SPHI|nr:FecR family protein [Pedobacter ginsenosidimutans]KRT15887.1 hypothetical protein ASU31_12965 [Pedobacter ginsenosidimutans]